MWVDIGGEWFQKRGRRGVLDGIRLVWKDHGQVARQVHAFIMVVVIVSVVVIGSVDGNSNTPVKGVLTESLTSFFPETYLNLLIIIQDLSKPLLIPVNNTVSCFMFQIFILAFSWRPFFSLFY